MSSLVLRPPGGAMGRIPAWWSRAQFVDDVAALLTTPEGREARRRQRVAASTVLEVARATAKFAERSTGRWVAVSNERIAGMVGRCIRVVQRARRVLEAIGVDVVLVEGRYLTVDERQRAGRGQIRAASTRCLTHPQGAARRRVPALPPSSSVTPSSDTPLRRRTSRSRKSIKRVRADHSTPVKPPKPRPLQRQRLAAALEARMPHLTRFGREADPRKRRHIGAIMLVLEHAGVPDEASADRILAAIENLNRDRLLVVPDPVDQRRPLALFAWQLSKIPPWQMSPPRPIDERLARAGLPPRRGHCAHDDRFGHGVCIRCGEVLERVTA